MDELESSVDDQNESLRLAAHDMRQHFHVIEMGLQLLEREEATGEQHLETIRLLRRENQQAQHTLDSLLKALGATSLRHPPSVNSD
ncbi:MAG: hypothetical protein ABI614_07150 [Planctomycetota bacterium]